MEGDRSQANAIKKSIFQVPWWLSFLLGGFCGVLLDQIHVQFGVLTYKSPIFWNQAWWVFPLFGTATVVLLYLASFFWEVFSRRSSLQFKLAVIPLDFFVFIGVYFLTGMFKDRPYQFAITMFCLWIGYVFVLPNRGLQISFAVSLAVLGTLFEASLSATGVFWYYNPDFLGVPIWLPCLYLFAAPVILSTPFSMKKFLGTKSQLSH